jgi:hypothetical protein
VFNNAGLCGDLVSVGTGPYAGTSYPLYGTWLGYACTSTRGLEDRSEYLTCIANPAGCIELYAARPPPRQRVRACDALSVAEWLGGWGTQGPVEPWAYGHHPDDRGVVHEHDGFVRLLPPSTLHVASNDGGY